jgi:hypothetical protein
MSAFLFAAAGFAEMNSGAGDTFELVGLVGMACLIGYIAYFMLQCFVEFLMGERQFSLRRLLYITTLIALAIALCSKFQILLP